jgi:hypothetical protein
MKNVSFYGASDDLIEVEGDCPGCDEYNAERGVFVATGPDGGVRIALEYGGFDDDKGPTWEVAVAMLDEDHPMLPVAVTGSGYTCRAVVSGATLVVRASDD